MKQNSSQQQTKRPSQQQTLKTLLLLTSGAVILVLLLLIPFPPVCGGDCVETGTDYHVLIDQSQSRKDANEQTEWRKTALEIATHLQSGDSIRVIGINAHSDQTAVLFQARMPVMPKDPISDEEKSIGAEWKRIRQEASAGIEAALNPTERASWSDLFGALDRIKVEPKRRTQILILSDMLHSTPDGPDLERVRITERNTGEILTQAVAKYRWERGRWAGQVQVHCVLNSLDTRASRPLNDRLRLCEFWRVLFEHFTNDKHALATFDTQLPINQIGG
jgi:hypothetical protein